MRSGAQWVMRFLGWWIALNLAAAGSLLGWIPAFGLVAPKIYYFCIGLASVPLAVWMAKE